MRIILGSESEGRKKVLSEWGYEFTVVAANIDEKAIRAKDPETLTLKLAHAKATALSRRLPVNEVVLLITADQVVVYNGEVREKPVDAEQARAFLMSSALKPVSTVTSVVVTHLPSGQRWEGTDRAKISFRPIPLARINAYIETGDPFRHSGGFDHEHEMIAPFVRSIDGEPESIIGLPRTLTLHLISRAQKEVA